MRLAAVCLWSVIRISWLFLRTEKTLWPVRMKYDKIPVKADYDLMAAVMICLGKEGDSGTDLLNLLHVLLSTETGSQDKCQILEEDFHIKMTLALESEVSLMCNLSKGVEEKGIEKGRQEGRQEGIIAMVSALKDLQIADSIILKKIQEKFHLAEETAKMYL